MISKYFYKTIIKATGAASINEIDVIQELWSGYGKILRIHLAGSSRDTVVVKHVRLSEKGRHPGGLNTDFSHRRKLKSYRIETAWYKQWSDRCTADCKVPQALALEKQGGEVLMVLEDLDGSGYPGRRRSVNRDEMNACISWLAHFHAVFLNEKPANLWKTGTYWHLGTRPDELKVLADIDLKKAASFIDQKLRESPYQTFVHGDAKLANFCFAESGTSVAAVDFQYVGGGCGMKDLAYFTGSCLNEDECESYESYILDFYFQELGKILHRLKKTVDINALEQEWRSLYHVAWTDFHRFLKGWSPGHYNSNSYSERVARSVIEKL